MHGTFDTSLARKGRWASSSIALVASLIALSLISALIVNSSKSAASALFSDPDAPSHKSISADDVNHDAALDGIFGSDHSGSHQSHKARNGKYRGKLSASSSIQDFMKAAMDGHFDDGKNVKLATDGIFGKSPRLRTKSHHLARQQALAERNVFRKFQSSHMASRIRKSPEHALVSHFVSRPRPAVSEKGWKFPTEDKFVAQYTGSTPQVVPSASDDGPERAADRLMCSQGDVIVDRLVPGPYVPL